MRKEPAKATDGMVVMIEGEAKSRRDASCCMMTQHTDRYSVLVLRLFVAFYCVGQLDTLWATPNWPPALSCNEHVTWAQGTKSPRPNPSISKNSPFP
jgi:hypothetical protein